MKYHINNKGEVKPCQAKISCRFGGKSGSENHFYNLEEAVAAAQSKFSKKYDPMAGIKKVGSPNSLFISNRNRLRSALISFGLKNEESLPEVKNIDDIINNWFGGDPQKYERVLHIIENSIEINPETQRALGEILDANMDVQVVTMENLSNTPKRNAFNGSTVDLIDDAQTNRVDVEAIMSGKLTAFPVR